jgi:hypothetical protein
MSKTCRFAGILLGIALLSAGCDKSATTGPGKPGDETYGKKLVGVWEGTEEGKKGEKPETVTVEFKADNTMKIIMGPFALAGTWKVAKEEGKTVTIDTEVTLDIPELKEKDKPKADKKTFTVTFEDANNITLTPTDKPDPKKLKRKS